MIKNMWILWAMCLIVPGSLGLVVYGHQGSTFREQLAQARMAESKDSTVQDYIRMYEQWSALEPEEKADNPWGFGDYGGANIRKQLEAGQSDRLLIDFAQLTKGVNHYPDPLADVIYGNDWREKVNDYEAGQARTEMLLTASTFLAACGGLILFGGLTKIAVTSFIRMRKTKSEASKAVKESDTAQSETSDASGVLSQDKEDDAPEDTGDEPPVEKLESEPDSEDSDSEPETDVTDETPQEGYFGGRRKSTPSPSSKRSIPSLSPAGSFSADDSFLKGTKDSYFGWAVDEHETPALEKLMTSEPLTRDLSVLTEEVSAIREFAAQQQDQVRKLQDGYDWMIIRRFCQRIIRSVDNIEDRFASLQEAGDDAANYLEDIRDELIFALESSGVEQFKPDLHTPFKGLEKYVEAVRERIGTDDESLAGTIAEIIRPGYQYLVNDDEVKIIRCAQVKLYELETSS